LDPKHIRIFVSSPGDVIPERRVVELWRAEARKAEAGLARHRHRRTPPRRPRRARPATRPSPQPAAARRRL